MLMYFVYEVLRASVVKESSYCGCDVCLFNCADKLSV